jgi:hypothetical protein
MAVGTILAERERDGQTYIIKYARTRNIHKTTSLNHITQSSFLLGQAAKKIQKFKDFKIRGFKIRIIIFHSSVRTPEILATVCGSLSSRRNGAKKIQDSNHHFQFSILNSHYKLDFYEHNKY